MNLTFPSLSIALSLLLLCISIVPEQASAMQPTVTLLLDNDTVYVDVNPGNDAKAVFTGTIVCEDDGGPDVQTVEGQLTASSHCPTSITPQTFIFEPGEKKTFDFKVTVRVPNFTPTSVTYSVEIYGKYTVEPGIGASYNIPPVSGTVMAEPFMDFVIEPPEKAPDGALRRGARGDELEYTLILSNDGNYEETFSISALDEDGRNPSGWKLDFVKDDFTVEEGQEIQINFTITIPEDAPPGFYEFDIIVESHGMEGSKNRIARNCTVYVDVDEEGKFPWWIVILVVIIVIVTLMLVVVFLKRKAGKR